MTSPLITAGELADRLGEAGLRIIDASWHLDGRDARADFAEAHIPGAVFLDLDGVSDGDSPLPHTLPSPAAFAASAGVLGLSDRDSIVVYDTAGLFSAARVWWMLKIMGARDVRVLDGGLPGWKRLDLPLETGPGDRPPFEVFSPRFDSAAVVGLDQVREALEAGEQVLDARGAARFRGEATEPRPGVRPGHMPGASNLPYTSLLNADGTLKRGRMLEAAFRDAGVDLDRPVITTCGSGVTAAILTLGLTLLDRPSRLYDGSWSEWGAPGGGPVATGT